MKTNDAKDIFDVIPVAEPVTEPKKEKQDRRWLTKKQPPIVKPKSDPEKLRRARRIAKKKEKEEQSDAISILVGAGIPQKTIARILKISPTYLTKHFQGELDDGGHEATAKIAKVLYKSAMAGNINAITLWLKSRAQWRDTSDKIEVTVEAAQLSEVERSQRLMAIMMKNPEFSEGMRQKRLVAQNQAAIDITPTSTLKGEEHEENGED